ncbi:MAG: hypothetical protein WC375_07860 [Methanomassiliicoccales archaeon]|jgi:hypothetical protein
MRLFSKFHDIYDPLFKYGISDKSFVFNRVQEEIEWKKPHSSIAPTEIDINGERWDLYYELVGFCGKIYPMVRFVPFSSEISGSSVYVYGINELCERFPVFAQYNGVKRTRKDNYQYHNHIRYSYFDIADWFKDLHCGQFCYVDPKQFMNLFMDKRCAYFYVKHGANRLRSNVVFYPSLKDISFHRNFASVMEMFQVLEMYLLNDLAQLDVAKAEPISDELHAQTHGFDKWSFRKEPSKRK